MTSPSDMLRMVGDGMHVARAIYSSSDDESVNGRRRIAAMFASVGRIARGEDYTIAAEASRLCRRAVSRGVTLTYEQVHAAASYGVTDERGDGVLAVCEAIVRTPAEGEG